MAYWLLKTEPDEYSWNDQVKRGAKGEAWTGVRNFTARRHLGEMKKGDKFFFYHTGDEKQVVGIGEVIRESFPDPTASKGEPWVAVTTVADRPAFAAVAPVTTIDSPSAMMMKPWQRSVKWPPSMSQSVVVARPRRGSQ